MSFSIMGFAAIQVKEEEGRRKKKKKKKIIHLMIQEEEREYIDKRGEVEDEETI